MRMRVPHLVPLFRSFKFAPVAIIALFFFTNLTGFFFNRAFAPSAQAAQVETVSVDDDFIPADIPSSGDHDLDLIIFHTAERYGVDPRLVHAVIWKESKYKPQARSHAGAMGLMQMMPATAKRFGCTDANDEASNVNAGTKYLRWLLKRFNGDVSLALAAYNAGEGSVDRYAGIPPFAETQNYVRVITARYGKTFHPILDPEQARVEFNLVPQVAQLTEQ